MQSFNAFRNKIKLCFDYFIDVQKSVLYVWKENLKVLKIKEKENMRKFTKKEEDKLKKTAVSIITLQTIIGTIDAISMPRKLGEKLFGKNIFRK